MLYNTKDYVFIGWNNTSELATVLKERIEKTGNSKCVIGGDHHENPPQFLRNDATINATVEFQISHCNHFVFLFSKKKDALEESEYSTLSGNLLYELGLARASSKFRKPEVKIDVFYLDIDLSTNDKKLVPSDLDGIWTHPISTVNKAIDAVADEIYKIYLRSVNNTENSIIQSGFRNKFNLIENSHLVEHELKNHFITPSMSDYELAQAILAYVQSAFCYQDQDFIYDKMKKFQYTMCRLNYRFQGLEWAVDFALNSLKLFCSTIPDESGKKTKMDFKLFSDIYSKYNTVADSISEYMGLKKYFGNYNLESFYIKDFDFLKEYYLESLILSQIQEHITFLVLVYLSSMHDTHSKDFCYFVDMGIRYSHSSIINLEKIKESSTSDRLFSSLLLSYVYKNLSTFYNYKESEEDKIQCTINKEKSYKLRKELREYVENNLSNPALVNYIELEYYSQLVDTLELKSNTFELVADAIKISDFIHMSKMSRDRRYIMLNTLIEVFNRKMDQLNQSENFRSTYSALHNE